MKIDIHTHVLPGIDDGAKDWETCIEMLAQSAASGVEKSLLRHIIFRGGKMQVQSGFGCFVRKQAKNYTKNGELH